MSLKTGKISVFDPDSGKTEDNSQVSGSNSLLRVFHCLLHAGSEVDLINTRIHELLHL